MWSTSKRVEGKVCNKIEHANISTIYPMLCEFLKEKDSVDIYIGKKKKKFMSSRFLLAAFSEYFDATLFGSCHSSAGSSSENESITLPNIDSKTFDEILKFFASGKVVVTDYNIYNLLHASHFLKLKTSVIEDDCVTSITHLIKAWKPKLIPNALKILTFSIETEKRTLVDLLSSHVCEHINYWLRDPRLSEMMPILIKELFGEITYQNLEILLQSAIIGGGKKIVIDFLSKYIAEHYFSDSLLRNPKQLMTIQYEAFNEILKHIFSSDEKLAIIIQWVDYFKEERTKYCEELMRNIDFTQVSAVMLNEYEIFMDCEMSTDQDSGTANADSSALDVFFEDYF